MVSQQVVRELVREGLIRQNLSNSEKQAEAQVILSRNTSTDIKEISLAEQRRIDSEKASPQFNTKGKLQVESERERITKRQQAIEQFNREESRRQEFLSNRGANISTVDGPRFASRPSLSNLSNNSPNFSTPEGQAFVSRPEFKTISAGRFSTPEGQFLVTPEGDRVGTALPPPPETRLERANRIVSSKVTQRLIPQKLTTREGLRSSVKNFNQKTKTRFDQTEGIDFSPKTNLGYKFDDEVKGITAGFIGQFRQKPVTTAGFIGVGYVAGLAIAGAPVFASRFGSVAVKATTFGIRTIGVASVGAESFRIVTAPTPEARGQILAQDVAFVSGAKFGSRSGKLSRATRKTSKIEVTRLTGEEIIATEKVLVEPAKLNFQGKTKEGLGGVQQRIQSKKPTEGVATISSKNLKGVEVGGKQFTTQRVKGKLPKNDIFIRTVTDVKTGKFTQKISRSNDKLISSRKGSIESPDLIFKTGAQFSSQTLKVKNIDTVVGELGRTSKTKIDTASSVVKGRRGKFLPKKTLVGESTIQRETKLFSEVLQPRVISRKKGPILKDQELGFKFASENVEVSDSQIIFTELKAKPKVAKATVNLQGAGDIETIDPAKLAGVQRTRIKQKFIIEEKRLQPLKFVRKFATIGKKGQATFTKPKKTELIEVTEPASSENFGPEFRFFRTPTVETTTRVLPSLKTNSIPKQENRVRQFNRVENRIKQENKVEQFIRERVKNKVRNEIVQKPIVNNRIINRQLTQQQLSRINTPPFTTTTTVPLIPPVPPPTTKITTPFLNLRSGSKTSRKSSSSKFKQEKRFTPTLFATALGIRGKRSKKLGNIGFTGLELRPLPKK